MKYQLTYSGYLKIGQYKSIAITCNLRLEVIDDDEFGEIQEYISSEYINGVKIEGDLYFDSPPIKNYYQDGVWHKHPIQNNVIATINLSEYRDSSKFNIVLLEKVSEIEIMQKKIIRYFWTFLPVGNPIYDGLNIFPEKYRWNNKMNRVYYCTNFRGSWPVGVASIVVAPDKKKARQLLDSELEIIGIPVEKGSEMYSLIELDITKEQSIILANGNF